MWSVDETGLKNKLEIIQNQWKLILNEALAVLDSKSGGFTKYFEEINESKYFLSCNALLFSCIHLDFKPM